MMGAIYEKIKDSRKLMFAIILWLVATGFYIFLKNVEFGDWAEFSQWIFGIYAGGNVGEHVSRAMNQKKDEPEVQP